MKPASSFVAVFLARIKTLFELADAAVTSKETVAAMKKHDFPAGGPHQSLEGKKAALQHATIRAGEPKKKKVDWEKGKFSKATLAAMKKHDFPGGSPHQTVAGKKAALQHASIRAGKRKKN